MAKHCEYVQQLAHLKVLPEEIEEIVKKKSVVKKYAFIVHDRDVYSEKDEKTDLLLPAEKRKGIKAGDLKPAHVHVYLNFGQSSASFRVVAAWFKDGEERVSKVHGRMGDMLKYLTHSNSPEKYQYSLSEVSTNMDIEEEIAKDAAAQRVYGEMDAVLLSFAAEEITFAQTQIRLKEIRVKCSERKQLEYWNTATKMAERIWKQNCAVSTKGQRDMEIIFIYGESGVGKSTYAEMYAAFLCNEYGYRDVCRGSANNDVLQDYMGEDILILDDYRDVDEMTGKAHSLPNTLKMLDPHFASSSESRYTNKTFTGKLIIITSTKDPLTWFEGTKEQRWQFFRRITSLIEIDEHYVTEYCHIVEIGDISYSCGFVKDLKDENVIRRAPVLCRNKNPVWEYLKYIKPASKKSRSVSSGMTSYMGKVAKENGGVYESTYTEKEEAEISLKPPVSLDDALSDPDYKYMAERLKAEGSPE